MHQRELELQTKKTVRLKHIIVLKIHEFIMIPKTKTSKQKTLIGLLWKNQVIILNITYIKIEGIKPSTNFPI